MATDGLLPSLDALEFDNRFTASLPADPETENFCRQVYGASYSRVTPRPVVAPQRVAFSPEVAALLDLDPAVCRTEDFAQVFAGNRLLPGMDPHAMCYGGHQFGNWAGQLGDGRAINLGEVHSRSGQHWMLQLKGAGKTPYSRHADGLAVLRSSLREFLCSEAMHHLGIPTTRALSLILTGETVERDMFYDGNPQQEPGAVVCRVAPSFLRLGNYEIHAARKEHDLLRQLLDFTITTEFPVLGEPGRDTYIAWFGEVCRRTAELMAHWMRVGFVHGVMNTDNLSVLGLTIDYGPYGWLEGFDPDWTPNTTDAQGRRYRYGNQPQVALWNLAQLANAIYPLIEAEAPLQDALETYRKVYEHCWRRDMAAKLGLPQLDDGELSLVDELHRLLQMTETDMTIFYRRLADVDLTAEGELRLAPLSEAWYQSVTPDYKTRLHQWLDHYARVLGNQGANDAGRRVRMNTVNPKYVLRNYLAQQAIDKVEAGDFSEVDTLLDLLRRPYDEQPEREHYFARRPEWARHRAGCSMLSCSS